MTDKITLTNLVNLTNQTTAVNAINANNAEIETAFDNTLSRDGTQPNTMGFDLDMNNNQIVNLPAPASNLSPLRLADVGLLNGSGTINTVPSGGNTHALLEKTSNASFIMDWTNTPTIATILNTGTLTLPTSTDTLVGRSTADTLINKTISGTNNTLTVPISTSVSGLGTNVATFLGTPSSVNLAAALTDETGTGSNVFANTPTMTTPNIIGTVAGDNAAAGSIGEYQEIVIPVGSAVSLTTSTSTSLNTPLLLTAGDWDVSGQASFITAGTTSTTMLNVSLSTNNNTLDFTNGRVSGGNFQANAPGASNNAYNITVGPVRFNFTTSTGMYLVVRANFTTAALSGYGILRARRIR